jgi:hypothetical protein
MNGKGPKSEHDTRDRTPLPLARPRKYHGRIGIGDDAAHHVGAGLHSERTGLCTVSFVQRDEIGELTNALGILARASEL